MTLADIASVATIVGTIVSTISFIVTLCISRSINKIMNSNFLSDNQFKQDSNTNKQKIRGCNNTQTVNIK